MTDMTLSTISRNTVSGKGFAVPAVGTTLCKETEINFCGACGVLAKLVNEFEPASPLEGLNMWRCCLTPSGRLTPGEAQVTVFKDLKGSGA